MSLTTDRGWRFVRKSSLPSEDIPGMWKRYGVVMSGDGGI